MKAVRAVIAGAGVMGRWHAQAARRAGATVVGVVDPDLARATRIARGSGAFDSLAAALHHSIDVVHVCTPLATHFALCQQALAAGCHVIVEKPVTPTADEAIALTAAAHAAGRILVPVHQFAFQRGVQSMREHWAELGTIRHLEFATCSAGALHKDASERDAVVAEIVPHPLSLARNLLGISVSELAWQLQRPAPGEWRFGASTAGGAAISGLVSMSARPTFASLRVLAEHGSVVADLFHGFAIFEGGRASRGYKIVRPLAVGVRGTGIALGNLVRRAVDGESAYPGLRALCAATYAAIDGSSSAPFAANEIVDVARARDQLIALASS